MLFRSGTPSQSTSRHSSNSVSEGSEHLAFQIPPTSLTRQSSALCPDCAQQDDTGSNRTSEYVTPDCRKPLQTRVNEGLRNGCGRSQNPASFRAQALRRGRKPQDRIMGHLICQRSLSSPSSSLADSVCFGCVSSSGAVCWAALRTCSATPADSPGSIR